MSQILAANPPATATSPPDGAASSPADKRAAFGQWACSRPSCKRPFRRRRAAGRAQRFCTVRCRRLADAEFRRLALIPLGPNPRNHCDARRAAYVAVWVAVLEASLSWERFSTRSRIARVCFKVGLYRTRFLGHRAKTRR
jgi:hypothetical protein